MQPKPKRTVQLMKPRLVPPRFWCLFGEPDTGKTEFLSAMRQPLMGIDADQRLQELVDRHPELQMYPLSDTPEDNVNTAMIAQLLDEIMPGLNVATIVVDSVTAIIAPLVTAAMVQKQQQGKDFNLAAGFQPKALAVRQLQDSITKWRKDFVLVYHSYEARDEQAKVQRRPSLPRTELARLVRSINLRIEIGKDRGRYWARPEWARNSRAKVGMVLWDEKGNWVGMPERIEAAVYGGLSQEDLKHGEQEPPDEWKDEPTAIAWGVEHGPFTSLQHARNAWDKMKRESGLTEMPDLSALWVAEIQRRQKEAEGGSEEEQMGLPLNGTAAKPTGEAAGKLADDGPTRFWAFINENKFERAHALKVLEDTGANYDEAIARLIKERAAGTPPSDKPKTTRRQ